MRVAGSCFPSNTERDPEVAERGSGGPYVLQRYSGHQTGIRLTTNIAITRVR